MLSVSNGLTLLRGPLALLFLQESPFWRFVAVILAMITDSIDGHLARKSKTSSKLGAVLDPAMDKFFVYFALFIFSLEHKVDSLQIAAILSRDMALAIYGVCLLITGKWRNVIFRGIRWGKITTSLQFVILMGLCCNLLFPQFVYYTCALFGVFSLIELFYTEYTASKNRHLA
jgi:CDP-diacylglycerol---glycerol-3-phosphate 3-phosphatidyltransferase